MTYEWSGSWEQLQSGIVLLTWQQQEQSEQTGNSFWLHDRAIGMGALNSARLSGDRLNSSFQVIERRAMLPDINLIPGNYTLQATYLNRKTGETYPIAVPPVTLTIDPTAVATPAPELDLVTQFRAIAPNLSQGLQGLELIFAQTARINQYQPVQDYLAQADLSLSYRLGQGNQGKNVDWAYTIALSRVLQQDIEGAIVALKRVIQLDSNNPYPYAYLAFVYLYDWRPREAQEALKSALTLNPNIPEIQALSGIAALMQGNFIKAWQVLQRVLPAISGK